MSDKESESLEVHVAHCTERYQTLFNRIRRIETLIIGFFSSLLAALVASVAVLVNRLADMIVLMPPGGL